MLRYVITFPAEVHITPERLHALREMLSEAANDRAWRDLVISHGGTITDMRPPARPVSALVRRARSRVR